jgi:hypothetical protein
MSEKVQDLVMFGLVVGTGVILSFLLCGGY